MLEIVKSFLRPGETPQAGSVRGQYYERTGACNQCGSCCSHIYLVFGQQTINSIAMFKEIQEKNPEYRYFKPLTQQPMGSDPGDGLLFQCTHLQADNSCGIYADRPAFCRSYPSEHGMLMGAKLAENCGYRFRLLKTFQQVLQSMGQEAPAAP